MPLEVRLRRGNATYSVATAMALLGFGALVIDVGRARVVRAELQNAAEAAALGGAAYLDSDGDGLTDPQGVDDAVRAARALAALNNAAGAPAVLRQEDVFVGRWDADTGTIDRDAAVDEFDAVGVSLRLDDLGTFLAGGALGHRTMSARAASIAVRPPLLAPASVECALPLAIPDCLLDGDDVEDVVIRLSSAADDNAAWALPGSSRPSASALQRAARAAGYNEIDREIVGFVRAYVYDVTSGGGADLRMRLDVSHAYDVADAGSDGAVYGSGFQRAPRLVR